MVNLALTAAYRSSTAYSSEMSAARASTSSEGFSALIESRTASAFFCERETSTMPCAPARANARAIPCASQYVHDVYDRWGLLTLPIPLPAPVMIATLPAWLNSVLLGSTAG